MEDFYEQGKGLQAAGWKQRSLGGFADRFGPVWTKKESDGWAYGILATRDHLNPAGFVHGGGLCALFDHVVSAVAWEAVGRRACVTVQLSTQFLAAAREGQFLEARARISQVTSSLVFVDGFIGTGETQLLRGSSVQKIIQSAS